MRPILIALITLALLAAAAPQAEVSNQLRGEELMQALQKGGYTILVRHARTDRNAAHKETPGTSPLLRSDQRNLSAAGEEDVRLMLAAVRKYELPIGEVITSQSYRCRETADAFGTWSVNPILRTFPTTNETANLIAAPPKKGTNRVLVTHHYVIENHVPGIFPGDIAESEAAVVRPAGDGKVALVGTIKLADWEKLAGVPRTVVASPAQHGGSPAHGAPLPAHGATSPAHGAPLPAHGTTSPAHGASSPAHGASSPAVHHSAPAGAAVIPSTRAGKLAAAYLEAFNSGDAAKMYAFTESSLVAVPERPTAVRVQAYERLFAENGPMTVTAIQSSTDDKIVMRTRSKRGDLIVMVTASAEQTSRAQSVTIAMQEGGGGH